jgi:hypothetical protein
MGAIRDFLGVLMAAGRAVAASATGGLRPVGGRCSSAGGSFPAGAGLTARGVGGVLGCAARGVSAGVGHAAAAPLGQITEFSSGADPGAFVTSVAAGPDGNLWFSDRGSTPAIGRITPSGTITEFSTSLNAGRIPDGIAAGPDGNVWFTDVGTTPAIGQIGTGAATAIQPSNTYAPTGYGNVSTTVGNQFTGSAGSWSGTQPISYAYAWLRCPDTTIAHCAAAFQSSARAAASTSYTLQQADVGDRMRLEVTAANAAGNATADGGFSGVIQSQLTVSTATPDAAATTVNVPGGQPTVRAQIQLPSSCANLGICAAGDSVRPLILNGARPLILGSYVKHHARRGRLRLQVSVSRRELRYLRHRHIHRLRHATLVITIVPRHVGAVTVIHGRPFTIPIR